MGNKNDNKVPDLKKEIKTEEAEKGRSNKRSKYKGKRKGNNKHGKKKGSQKPTSQSTFKGSINEMNGHVFECYGESQMKYLFPINKILLSSDSILFHFSLTISSMRVVSEA
jgi:hypothetical protein